MKLLALFLLCGLAAASATNGISSDYGLLEDVQTVFGQFAEKIRQHLQQALDKLKAKIEENRFLFELLKPQIAAIQKKIVQLAKDKLVEKLPEIKNALFNLLENYLEKLHKKEEQAVEYALYEAQQGSFLDRVAERVKATLEKFLAVVTEKVDKYTDIANDIKDKILAIKEKLQEIPKAGAAKLLEIAKNVRNQIKALLTEVIEKISHKEEAQEYALYDASGEGFLENLSQRITNQLQKFLARIVELVNKYTDIAKDISDKVIAIKDKLAEIPKAGLSKLFEIATNVRQQLKDLLKEAVDKIAQKHDVVEEYAMYDTEGGFFAQLAERIRARFDKVLSDIQQRLEKYHELALQFGDKIQAIKDKLKELSKASGFKLLEIAQNLQQQVKDLLQKAWDAIKNKQVAEYSLITFGEESFVTTFSRVLKERLQAILNAIRERLEQHKDVFESFKSKLEEIQEKINELSKSAVTKAISIAQAIKTKLTELIRAVADKIGVFNIPFPLADEGRKPGEFSRRRLQTHLDELKKRVAKYPEVQAKYQEKLDDLQKQVDQVADLSGLNLALTSSQVQRKIGALRNEILLIIGNKPSGTLLADEDRKPGEFSRRRLQTHLDELKKRVAKYPEVQAKYQEKLDDLQKQVDQVAELSGVNLALTSSQVQRRIGALRNEILLIIGNKRPGSF